MAAGKPMLGCLAGLAMKLPTGLEATLSLKLAGPDASEVMPAWVGVTLAGAGAGAEAGTGAGAGIGLAGVRVVLTGAAMGPAEGVGPAGASVASAGAEAVAAGAGWPAGRMGLSESVGVLPGAKPTGVPTMPAARCRFTSSI